MNCKNCNRLIPYNSVTCPFCGSSVLENKDTESTQVIPITPDEPVLPQDQQASERSIPSIGDGVPTINENITSNLDFTEKKKKSIIPIIIIALIMALVLGTGGFFYLHEYKSADKRIDALIGGLLNFTKKNISSFQSMYSVDANANVMGTNASLAFTDNISYDSEKKLVINDFTLEKINVGLDLINKPLSGKTAVKNNDLYITLSNIFDNYITFNFEKSFDYSNNDVNEMIAAAVNCFKGEIKEISTTQGIEKTYINGVSKYVNVLKFTINTETQEKIINQIINGINENLVKESTGDLNISKVDAAEFLVYYKSLIRSNINIELYTPVMKNDFLGLKVKTSISNVEYSFNVVSVQNGYKMSLNKENDNLFSLNYTNEINNVGNKKKSSTNFDLVVEYNGKNTLNVKTVRENDFNPTIADVDVSSSVKYQDLSEDEIDVILTKLSEYTNLGGVLGMIGLKEYDKVDFEE